MYRGRFPALRSGQDVAHREADGGAAGVSLGSTPALNNERFCKYESSMYWFIRPAVRTSPFHSFSLRNTALRNFHQIFLIPESLLKVASRWAKATCTGLALWRSAMGTLEKAVPS